MQSSQKHSRSSSHDFYAAVYRMVQRIPKGRVATYGQIAALLGRPRGARLVGWALNSLNNLSPHSTVPWQRVINREGRISIVNRHASKQLQADLLRHEGIRIEERDGNYWINLHDALWKP